MASNSFGSSFKVTTFGESHSKIIGCVIDGCPPNIEITEEEINLELRKRAPGSSPFTSARKEVDKVQIVSGIFEGKTTGAPLAILIENKDVDSSYYEENKNIYRPSHGNFTYLHKYGIFDYRGGGRASARETALRVAAATIAKKVLKKKGIDIEIAAFLNQIHDISVNEKSIDIPNLKSKIDSSPIFCPDKEAESKMIDFLQKIKEEKDSIGGIVRVITTHLPIGLGDPIYEKFSANLAKAMFSIPGCIGFEIGKGFEGAKMKGSKYNDLFTKKNGAIHNGSIQNGSIVTKSNNQGGIQAGISNGNPLDIKVAFKPTPTIGKPQQSIDITGNETILPPPNNNRYDICIAIRACKVVEAMTILTIVNLIY